MFFFVGSYARFKPFCRRSSEQGPILQALPSDGVHMDRIVRGKGGGQPLMKVFIQQNSHEARSSPMLSRLFWLSQASTTNACSRLTPE